MSPLAPKWALSAQAIDSAGNPYLAPGVHLRIIPSQEFGLPVAPFIVFRTDITQRLDRFLRDDIIWTDRRGQVLSLPFEISVGEPVTGWLPPIDRGVCCWIQAQVEPFEEGGLRMDALVHHSVLPLRPAVIASTRDLPLTLSASRIDRIVLSGEGNVMGARWLDARMLLEESNLEFWRVLSLPVEAGARYSGILNAQAEALDRLLRGAPPFMGRHEELTAFFASTGGVVSEAEEMDRVGLFMPDIDQWLDQLVNDLSLPIHELVTEYEAQAPGAKPLARKKLDLNTLGLLMQSSMDPGIARYLGFMETDKETVDFPSSTVLAYVIRGFFRFDKERHSRFVRALAKEQVIDFEQGQAILEEFGLSLPSDSEIEGLVDLTVVAVATVGHPPEVPGAPTMDPADTSGPFLPTIPPAARREVVLRGNRFAPLIALERHDSNGPQSLNALTSDGKRALPIVPSIPNPGVTAAEAEVTDRDAAPEALIYRLAMADWFGRWGDWVDLPAAAKARPLPPIPTPNVHYSPPSVNDATPLDTALGGTLRVELPVPPLENLPAGGLPLRRAHIAFQEGTSILFTEMTGPGNPHAASEGKLIVTLTDHASLRVNRASRRTVSLTARWEDTDESLSAASPPITIEMTDPRPPESVVIPDTLKYSARPDALGIARVDLRWSIAPTQRRFRVYYADEIGARAYLESKAPTNPAASSALAAVNAAENPVALASAFKLHAAALGPAAFDQLTKEALIFTGSEGRFVHDLSGSLQILSLYRVVALSESNVEAPFGSSALVPVGVPNSPPPVQPFLTLRAVPNGTRPRSDQVVLVLEAARRPTRPVEYRLRRSTVNSTDVLSMPVVSSGTLPAPDGENVRTELEQGLDTAQPLRPWIRYFWRVEVRGESEQGASEMGGQWSTASAAVSATLIPAGPASAARDLVVLATAAEHTLTWTHPDPRLDGGTMGAYRFEIFQQRPGDRTRSVGVLSALSTVSAGGRPAPDGSFTFTIPVDASAGVGTGYRVVVYDPMNRASSPAVIQVTEIQPDPPSPPA